MTLYVDEMTSGSLNFVDIPPSQLRACGFALQSLPVVGVAAKTLAPDPWDVFVLGHLMHTHVRARGLDRQNVKTIRACAGIENEVLKPRVWHRRGIPRVSSE